MDRLDERWTAAIEAIARHLGLLDAEPRAPSWPTPSQDRWMDWQVWQEFEASLVSHVLKAGDTTDVAHLAYLRRAQKLLALQWHLLEALSEMAGGDCSG
jgi:hypothetical protein